MAFHLSLNFIILLSCVNWIYAISHNTAPNKVIFTFINPTHMEYLGNGSEITPKRISGNYNIYTQINENILNYGKIPTVDPNRLFMTRKVEYGYKFSLEKAIKINKKRQKAAKKVFEQQDPYRLIHAFMYQNDPNNPNFKYDVDIAKIPRPSRPRIRLRFFWYASRLKRCVGPVSRTIDYTRNLNEFRFSKFRSFFHILPYVHEHYKDHPLYIFFMNRYLRKRCKKSLSPDEPEVLSKLEEILRDYKGDEQLRNEKLEELLRDYKYHELIQNDKIKEVLKEVNLKEVKNKKLKELKKEYERDEEVIVDEKRKIKLKYDSFKVYGEYFSTIDKKNRSSPYDIWSPFLRTKYSSKRRRFREKIPLDPNLRFKTRRERRLFNKIKLMCGLKSEELDPTTLSNLRVLMDNRAPMRAIKLLVGTNRISSPDFDINKLIKKTPYINSNINVTNKISKLSKKIKKSKKRIILNIKEITKGLSKERIKELKKVDEDYRNKYINKYIKKPIYK